jgi:hypothetical protein
MGYSILQCSSGSIHRLLAVRKAYGCGQLPSKTTNTTILSSSWVSLCLKLDTEGTDSLVKDPENDTKVFTLAVLISTYFIYNSVGSIDERSVSEI